MLTIKSCERLKLSVVVDGLPRCKHELSLRLRNANTPFFYATDVSYFDKSSQDEDPRWNVDVYSIDDVLKGKTGIIIFDWNILLGKVASNVPYKVIVSLVQNGVPLISETYSNTDSDAAPGLSRFIIDYEVIEIKEEG